MNANTTNMAVWNTETNEMVGYTKWDREGVRKSLKYIEKRDDDWEFEVIEREGNFNNAGSVKAIDCSSSEWVAWAFKEYGKLQSFEERRDAERAAARPAARRQVESCHYCGCEATGHDFYGAPVCDGCR